MATLNYAFKELSCKIVYYGCGLCGKTTNLIHIHKTVPQKFRGDLVSLATEQDRTLFFDFLPLDLGEVKGFKTKFQLYTVPGQVYYNATRKLVLRGVDGLVFVADSQRDRLQENLDSLENLKQNLEEYGYHLQNGPDDAEGVPWVLQYNKRDMPQVSTLEELNKALNSGKVPTFEAVAVSGQGVKDTLKGISSLVIKKLNKDTTTGIAGEKSTPPAGVGAAAKSSSPAPAKAAVKDDEYEPMDENEDELASASSAKTDDKKGGVPKLPNPKPNTPPPPTKAAVAASSDAPTLNVIHKCATRVRGMGLGSANLTLANLTGGDENQYQLTGKVSFLGIFGSTWSRKLRFRGKEDKIHNGGPAKFWKFESDDGAEPKLDVHVKDDLEKSLFVTYIGKLGEVKIAPTGKDPLG
ncbi:GTPase domain-containing protein [Candidatus Sumerlaeota bacterium]|nr:GTPase domain-containing protein [Candidatus Sumerlaeota bacterium]